MEPTADMRNEAVMHFQIFTAWVDAGFTEEQAMRLLGQFLAAALDQGAGE